MKLSIITVAYNAAGTIAETIESVLGQKNVDIEYIIIDGASTDGTSEIVNKYKDRIAQFVSEKDQGIYDAMNKGIKLATGHIIGLLNADDLYAYPTFLHEVQQTFLDQSCDLVYSNLLYIDQHSGKPLRYWKAGKFSKNGFKRGWMPPHPATFVHKTVYEKVGLFNLTFSISADYEFLLRAMHIGKLKVQYLNKTGVKMKAGGKSNVSVKNRLVANKEDIRAWQINGLSAPPFLRFIKPLRKLPQFFKIGLNN